jgi:hypothetical protein
MNNIVCGAVDEDSLDWRLIVSTVLGQRSVDRSI